jgi:hypothetical protein
MPHSDEPYGRVPAPYDPELSRLANSLADLQPRARPLDRDTLMFRAGQASVPRAGWQWPLVASLSSVLAVVFGAALLLRAAAGPAYQPVGSPVPASRSLHFPVPTVPSPAPPEETPLASPYGPAREPAAPRQAQLQEQLLRWGLDGLPPASPAPARPRPESIDMLLRSF